MIATGLRSAESPVKHDHVDGVFTLRSYDDAKRMHAYFGQLAGSGAGKPNVILVGGSFISMEAACYFADKANVVVMARKAPFESILGPEVARKVII